MNGIVGIPMQVIVTSELDRSLHSSLRVLTRRLSEDDAEAFVRMAEAFTSPGDRRNADAVLQLSIAANREVYEDLRRRDPEMCEALRELMKDEIQQERQEAADIALIAVIRNVMKSFGVDATKAMDSMGISPADQLRYAARL